MLSLPVGMTNKLAWIGPETLSVNVHIEFIESPCCVKNTLPGFENPGVKNLFAI